MPNLHEMGGENAAMIAAQLKEVTVHAAATVSSWGFVISPEQILQTAKDIGEPSVLNRAGGAPTLAVGIAHVFHKIIPMADMGFWYHFGILFEALFILTALDAGTRAGRFMLQDLLGNFVPFLKKPTRWSPGLSVPRLRRAVGLPAVSGRGRPAGRREEPVAAVRDL